MKSIKYILNLLVILILLFVTSCKKDSENVSKVTYYSVFNYRGEHFISILSGSTFTDPGVTATLNGSNYPVQATGSVDGNTPGVYRISYLSVNPDGFTASDYRYIGVIAPDAAAVDLSGTYARTSNGSIVHVTKIADGLYQDDNVGGSPGFEIPVYFFHTTGTDIFVPLQDTPAGTLECANATLTDKGFSWIVINGSFGTSTRKFEKQ